jgi:hypothetical protein
VAVATAAVVAAADFTAAAGATTVAPAVADFMAILAAENPAGDFLAGVLLVLRAMDEAVHLKLAAVQVRLAEVRMEECRPTVARRIFVQRLTMASGIRSEMRVRPRTEPALRSPRTIPEWPMAIGTDLTETDLMEPERAS